MSGIVPIADGEEIPLVLQVTDGAEDLYPRVILYRDTGSVLAQSDLTHVANGLYINSGSPVLMTNVPFVAAVFIIYTDAGRTQESKRYVRSTEVFAQAQNAGAADIAAIKAKTDQLAFTKANEVDVNVKSQNEATVHGTGVSGDLWRGYP